MIFQQLVNEDSGCLCYLIGCERGRPGRSWSIPGRDRVTEYLRLARKKGLRLAHVIETHTHADHISGARDLAATTKAAIHVHGSAGVAFEHQDRARRRHHPRGQRGSARGPHARPHARLDLPVRDRSRAQPRAVVRAHGRSALRRLGRPAGSRRRHRGRGHLVEPHARAAAARRQRRDLSGPRRRLLVRQGDVGQERIHHRLRAPLQSGLPLRRQERLRRLHHGRHPGQAGRLRQDRGEEPGPGAAGGGQAAALRRARGVGGDRARGLRASTCAT